MNNGPLNKIKRETSKFFQTYKNGNTHNTKTYKDSTKREDQKNRQLHQKKKANK